MVKTRKRAWIAVPLLAFAAVFAFAPAAFGLPAGALNLLGEASEGDAGTQEEATPNAETEENYTFGIGASLDKVKITLSTTSYTYNGKVKKPKITATLNGKKLKGTTNPQSTTADFYYFYMDNVAPGKGKKIDSGMPGLEMAEGPHVELVTFDEDGLPHVKVKCFTIKKASIKKAKIKVPSQVYTGKKLKPAVSVKFKGMTLKAGTDYKLKYSKNVKVGKAKVTITGKGAYSGKKTVTFKIKRASIANAKFSKVKARTYTGKSIKPKVAVKYNGKTLKKNKNYTIKYSKNKNAGIAKIKIKGKGDLKGSHTIEFVIHPCKISKAKVSVGSAVWTGGFVTPDVKLTYKGKKLESGKDYSVRFARNIDVGSKTGRAYIYAWGNYTGTLTEKFSVTRRPITNDYDVSAYWLNPLTQKVVSKPKYIAGSQPKPTLAYNGHYLRRGDDYTLSWTEPADAATKGGKGKVTITGKGSYKGTRTLEYTIIGKSS